MSNDQLTELKQFFVIALDTALEPIRADIRQMQTDIRQLQAGLQQLREEMDEGFAGVGEMFDQFYTQEDRRSGLLQELAQKWRAEAKN